MKLNRRIYNSKRTKMSEHLTILNLLQNRHDYFRKLFFRI